MSLDSSISERKERYKILLENLQKNQDSIKGFSVDDLKELRANIVSNDSIHQEAIEAINELLKNNTEIVLDAQVLRILHEAISKIFKYNTEFNDRAYSDALKSLICAGDDGAENWSAITDIALGMAQTTAMKTSMFGALEMPETTTQTIVKERRKRSKADLGTERRPSVLTEAKEKEPGAEKTNVALEQLNELFKANNYQPIPFYKLIIDPQSFTNTVENAFQLSFLVRDGNISLDLGSDSYPEVHYVSSEEQEKEFIPSQSICSLSLEICEEMRKFYDIKEAMLNLPADLPTNS